ncbi:unnamed protein product [Cladocopium goreaui]|uniref:Uncharacterized protein n=1 Tax=Cladocopium goreaui TaxID=2562237 RepID=A0A9P1C7P8_9DINO|nr:unnamed protein product [Cladocopium goreaui]
MSSLAERFAAMQISQSKETQDLDLQKLSYDQLKEMPIRFGSAKTGQSFLTVVKEDPKYCTWFLRQYGNSQKLEHREFLRFLELWTERQELEQNVGQKSTPALMTSKPKAKAKSGGGHGKSSERPMTIDVEEEEEESWDAVSLRGSQNIDEQDIAPRVGTLVLEKGPLFDRTQEACPDHVIRVLEICKGADRFRQSPIRLMPHEAPLRLTFGLLRQGLEPFNTGTWQPWEHLSVRRTCAKAPAARLMITVFARPNANAKREVSSSVSVLPTKKPRLSSEGDQLEHLTKDEYDPQPEVQSEVLPTDSQGSIWNIVNVLAGPLHKLTTARSYAEHFSGGKDLIEVDI